MAIIEKRPVAMAEVLNLVGTTEKSEKIRQFIKHFDTIPAEKALELKKELESLDLLRLKEDAIVKIIDFLPKSAIELNKIITDVSLTTEEVQKILDVTKKY